MKLKTIHGTVSHHLVVHDAPFYLKEELLNVLTFKNPAYDAVMKFSPYGYTQVPKFLCLAAEVDDELWLPRAYDGSGLSRSSLSRFNAIRWTDKRHTSPVSFPERQIKPSHEQQKILEAFDSNFKKGTRPFGNYLVLAGTGFGKTLAGLMLAEKLGQRTLILCRTNLIRDAWHEDLYKAFGMTRDDVGLIQGPKMRIGEQFTVASIATLTRRKQHWTQLFAQFGTVILDEAHVIGSDMVEGIVGNCGAKYVIGLTATHQRSDGKDYVLRHLIGAPIVNIRNTGLETASSLPIADATVTYTKFTYPDTGSDIDYQEVLKALVNDAERNELIVDGLISDFDTGHCVLACSPSLDHLDIIQALLRKRGYRFSILSGQTNSDKFYTRKLLDGIFKRTVRGVLGSTNAVKLGANLNPLDRLHIMIPPANKSDIEQLVGRIRRKHDGKEDAIVRYYLDNNFAYLSRRYKAHFVPVMRKLHVKRYENYFIA